MYKTIDQMRAYHLAMSLGEQIWHLTQEWSYFAKDTVGKQIVRCTDSIAANIAESHGRHFKRERKQFLIYARGSGIETLCFIQKCEQRKLISPATAESMRKDLAAINYEINKQRKHLDSLRE